MDQLSPPGHAAAIACTVMDTVMEVAKEQGIRLCPLTGATPLIDLGLDSLCLAVIVVRLEARLGMDPFSAEDVAMPATFGDFIALYTHV